MSRKRSERNFLADQAAGARAGMVRSLHGMSATLRSVADVPDCAARHPWLLTGSAVAVGFVTGAALTSVNAEAQSGRDGPEPQRAKKSILFSMVGTVLLSVFQPLILGWFTAPVGAERQPTADSPPVPDGTGAVVPENGVD